MTTIDPSSVKEQKDYIQADVLLFSCCRDNVTSREISNGRRFGMQGKPIGSGSCSSALLKTLYLHNIFDAEKDLSYSTVLSRMRSVLADESSNVPSQFPQLSASRPLDMSIPFEMIPKTFIGGVKRAVLIGINYKGTKEELSGCHKDIGNVRKKII